jgi:hypothetical protein
MVEDTEGSQAGMDDGGVSGPGAPTPLAALEVGDPELGLYNSNTYYIGMTRVLLVSRNAIFSFSLMEDTIPWKQSLIRQDVYWNRSRVSRSKRRQRS